MTSVTESVIPGEKNPYYFFLKNKNEEICNWWCSKPFMIEIIRIEFCSWCFIYGVLFWYAYYSRKLNFYLFKENFCSMNYSKMHQKIYHNLKTELGVTLAANGLWIRITHYHWKINTFWKNFWKSVRKLQPSLWISETL